MTDILYKWPEIARVGKRIPKERFYSSGAVTPAVREQFVNEVRSITWAFKLAEATINLPGASSVPEIQVFTLSAKNDDVSKAVLTAIDKSIPFPIIFEINRLHGDQYETRMVATHKQPASGKSKISTYYSTSWLADDTTRESLPTAISLTTLYAALLMPLTPIKPRSNEKLSEVGDRLIFVGKLEREIARLERMLHTEPQLNRKVEIRRTLQTKQHELEQQR